MRGFVCSRLHTLRAETTCGRANVLETNSNFKKKEQPGMNLRHLFNQVQNNLGTTWPITVAGAIAWVIVLAATIPSVIAITENKAEMPTWDDLRHMPDASSVGSSALSPMTGSSGMQEALGKHVTVNQGDFIDQALSRCTVGYIDHAANRIYLAGHCANTDTYTARLHGAPLGKFTKSDPTATSGFRGNMDVGYITPHKNVTLGENTYTGGASVIDASDVNVGDTLCFYGGRSKRVMCDVVNDVNEHYVSVPGTANGGKYDLQNGDSGGPAWLVDDEGIPVGVVGVASHVNSNPQENQIFTNRFAVLKPAMDK